MGWVSALDMDDSMIAEKNDVWWSVKFWGRIRNKIDSYYSVLLVTVAVVVFFAWFKREQWITRLCLCICRYSFNCIS